MEIKFTIKDKHGLIRNLFKANKNIDDALETAIERNARRIKNTLEEIVQTRSGFMRDHIRISFSEQKRTFEVGWFKQDFMVAETRYRFYPPYVMEGTSKMTGHNTLLEAFNLNEPYFKKDLKNAINKGINKSRS